MHKLEKIHSFYMRICFVRAWDKLKENAPSVKSKQRILKDVMILTKRIEYGSLRYCFDQLHKHYYVCNSGNFERILASRANIMFQALRKNILNKKKSAWFKLNSNSLKKKMVKRIMVVNFILKSAKRRHLLEAWNRLSVFRKQKDKKINASNAMEDLQLQVQDLKIQVENKNANITRLQD